MVEETLRRRRGQASASASTTSTTRADAPQPEEQTETPRRSPKTVDELVKEEERSFSQFLSLCGIVIAVFLYMIRTTDLPPPRRVYAVMIDAGSMGTRAQIFRFVHDKESDMLVLNGSELHKISKSIAALGTGVAGTGPQFFRPLLDEVKKSVPGIRRRQRTPILLRATAGLRLLGPHAADHALSEARKALNASEFLFRDEYVSILDPKDEGVFAWTTVNYLLGNLHNHGKQTAKPKVPVATLELGGASMQIVHSVQKDSEADDTTEQKDTHDLTLFGREYTLSTTSHLGLGLIDFTKRLYQVFDWEGVLEEGNPCFRKGKNISEKSLRLGVAGSDESRTVSLIGDGNFDRCVSSAQIAIASFLKAENGITALPDKSTAFAFAYFYDRTVGLGLPKGASKKQLLAKGRELCESSHDRFVRGDFDEACLEFSYIYAVLKMVTDDFSSSRAVSVRFEQYVDGHMLGWALGAVLDIIEPVVQAQIALDDEPLLMS